ENRAVAKSSLSVEIQLGGPPSRSPVFELRPEGVKVVPAALRAIRREILDFEVSRLFQIVAVRNEVGALMSLGDKWKATGGEEDQRRRSQRLATKQVPPRT